MDHGAAELDDTEERLFEVGDGEVRERNTVAGARAARVQAELGAAEVSLPALPLSFPALLEPEAEQNFPEPAGPGGIVRGELHETKGWLSHEDQAPPSGQAYDVGAARRAALNPGLTLRWLGERAPVCTHRAGARTGADLCARMREKIAGEFR